jgi:hypothetical protein
VCGGRSAGRWRMVRFSWCATVGSGGFFGRSVRAKRIVRQSTVDGPPLPCEQSAPAQADSLLLCLLCLLPLLILLDLFVACL